jgi:hypothetical protein
VYICLCVLSLSHVEHTWTDHLICSLFSARPMHAQQKSSPVSHSIELENITLGLHSVRQIQPRLMLIHSIPGRASFCALDASRACFFFIPILTRTARSVDWVLYLPAWKWVNTRFALVCLFCIALLCSQAEERIQLFFHVSADKLKVNKKWKGMQVENL